MITVILYLTKNGVITSVIPTNGTANVRVGDIVQKGTVLICGWMEGKYTDTRYVHADGLVYAKVWYTEKEKVYLNQVIQTKTGNQENK